MQKVYLNFLFLFFTSLTLSGQPKWELNLFGGASNYLGDLVEPPFPYLKASAPAFGAGIAFVPTPSLAFEMNVLKAQLKGDDHNIGEQNFMRRSLRFNSSLWEVNILTRVEPLSAYRYYEYGKFQGTMLPFFFIGGGVVLVNSNTVVRPETSHHYLELIEADRGHHEQHRTFAIPFGGGLRIDLNKRHAFDFRIGVKPTFTDYLDGISLSGNPESNDWYLIAGFRFVTRLGDKDSDKDGIPDREDFCPLVAGDLSAKGCPDADGDGVEDLEDVCPYHFGILDLNGCPDKDEDDLADWEDDCPGLAGPKATKGCPDKDGDGIKDSQDWCPGERGTKLLSGCPDCDNDGVIDWYDQCPETAGSPLYKGCPQGLYDKDGDGFVNEEDSCPELPGTVNGCPDQDGDAIQDDLDKCPEISGEPDGLGCPLMTKKELELLEMATKAIKFEMGSTVLKPESISSLDQIVAILKRYTNYHVEIRGHTDNIGRADRNLLLSEKRAIACYDFLLERQIGKNRMIYKGLGEIEPLADNSTDQGRRLNRRVEFILTPYIP